MLERVVVGIIAKNENSALAISAYFLTEVLSAMGFNAIVIDLASPEGSGHLDQVLKTGNVVFAYGYQGIGSNVLSHTGESLWGTYKVPFISLHYDHPCHNPYNHVNVCPYVGNIYFFNSFKEVKDRYLTSGQLSEVVKSGFSAPPLSSNIPFSDRPIKLLYIKTGFSLDDTLNDIAYFPTEIQNGFFTAAKIMHSDTNAEVSDLVADIFVENDIDRTQFELQFWEVVRLLERYVRRGRAILFVEWLKMQDGAVIIGDGWDFIDKSNAKATFKPAIPMGETFKLYTETQFVCNTNPCGSDVVHERILYGLGTGCCVISDSNAWLKENFSCISALTLFDWDKDLNEQLGPVICDTQRSALNSVTAREDVIQRFSTDPVPDIIEFAESVRKFAQNA